MATAIKRLGRFGFAQWTDAEPRLTSAVYLTPPMRKQKLMNLVIKIRVLCSHHPHLGFSLDISVHLLADSVVHLISSFSVAANV